MIIRLRLKSIHTQLHKVRRMTITSKQIIKRIGCPKLDLYKGEGYWYFTYDDEENNIFETSSVPVMYLNQMRLDLWVKDGLDFVKSVEDKG